MRLTLVTTYAPPHLGGIERIAHNLYRGYVGRGCEVRWITSRIPRVLPEIEGDIRRVPTWNTVEDRLGIPLPVWGPSAARSLRDACAWSDAVVVLEALYLTSALSLWLARRARKPTLLIQNVGFIPYASAAAQGLERLAYATLGRWAFGRATRVVLATPTADRYVRALMAGGRLTASTIPMGIDTAEFTPPSAEQRRSARAALGLAPGDRVALFACRLVEKKGVPIVLAAARRLPEVRFLVAGDGPQRALLAGAPANVRALGAVAMEEMGRLYHAADAVLLPSQGEGLPLFVQEAMASGLVPAISADEVYAADLVRDGACEAAAREPGAFAQALERCLQAGPERRARARAYAEAHWGMDRTVEAHLSLLGAFSPGGAARAAPPAR